MWRSSTYPLSPLLATVLVIALRPLAILLQLVDKPDARKTHKGDVPLGHLAGCNGIILSKPAMEHCFGIHHAGYFGHGR